MRFFAAAVMTGLVTVGCSTSPPAEPQMTDSQVEDRIMAQYATEPSLQRADLAVDANASEHKLTISGSVPTEAIRARALEIARGLQPGFEVTAKVDVKPMLIPRAEYSEDMAREAREKARAAGRTVGDSLEDAWIHTTITTKLAVDRDTPVLGVNVDVMNQAVTLRGTVDTATAKSEAERIAKETDGVKSVQNLLMVK